jgi:membrane protein implicated in regulation of membrane protease activity
MANGSDVPRSNAEDSAPFVTLAFTLLITILLAMVSTAGFASGNWGFALALVALSVIGSAVAIARYVDARLARLSR